MIYCTSLQEIWTLLFDFSFTDWYSWIIRITFTEQCLLFNNIFLTASCTCWKGGFSSILRKYSKLFSFYIRWHNTNLSMRSPFTSKLQPDSFPTSFNVVTFISSCKLPSSENIHTRIDSLNRCYGNIIVTAAITALCSTNSHKSSFLHKENLVALHSHPISRNCSE